MRVLAINQFYAPDHAATSQILTELCEDLVMADEKVTVIASRGGYLGGRRYVSRETIAGVDVVRPWATSLGKRTLVHRALDYSSFWTTAVAQAASEIRPDVMLALTTPPLIAAGAAMVAAARHIPLVTWVQDVYPDLAVAFGVLAPGNPAVRALRWTAVRTHRSSRRIVALSDGMAARLAEQGAPRDRIRVIHNWAEGRTLRPAAPDQNKFRAQHGLSGRFVAMYSGNIGVGHDVATIIGAAKVLCHRCPSILFLFVGDGSRRHEAERLSEGLANVRFLPYQPRDGLGESLAAADVHLVTLRDGLAGLLVPSKFYGALAVGRPVYYVGPRNCEVAEVINREELGWTGLPGDSTGLAHALERAVAEPTWTARIGERARQCFLDRYDRPTATAKWRTLLHEAAAAG